ncbi:hypothetical protein BH20ACI2_BH20ACI2_25190 [soil metagenome]
MHNGANKGFSFDKFVLDFDRRLLSKEGEAVNINPKAFDLLVVLVENHGRTLPKNDLLDKVWENQFVEENNLTVHIAALRRALGEIKGEHRFIVTVPGKGYRFVSEVEELHTSEIVVASSEFQRIVVEEEIGALNTTGRSASFALTRLGTASGIAAVLLVVVAAGAWLYSSRTKDNAPVVTPPSPQFSARVFTTAGGGVPDRVAISPDGNIIAFVERRKGQYSLKLGEIDTNNSVQIIPFSDRLYRYLTFSPDGKSIYFTARDENHLDSALMRVSILGGPVKDLIAGIHSSFTFSPDGRSVAFLRTDAPQDTISLITADAETGKNERVLLVRGGPAETVGAGLSWSPDGKLIALASAAEGGHRLMAVNIDDGSTQIIGNPVPNRIVNVAWLYDGSGLVVIRNTEPNPNDGQIWFVPYPFGESTMITDQTTTYSFANLSTSFDNKIAIVQTRSDPQIEIATGDDLVSTKQLVTGSRPRGEGMNGVYPAPDGRIVFSALFDDSRTIWEMGPDGSDQRQLTPFQKDSGDAQISVTENNRYLVFESNRTGELEIWRANRDGSDSTPLTNGGGNSQPALSPDGLWIVYVSLRDGKYGLRRISIDGGEPIMITTDESSWPDISPDGRFIAYAHGRGDKYPYREMRIIPFQGGGTIRTFEVPLTGVLYNRLRWSPDGKSIIYKDHTQGLWRQDLARDKPEAVSTRDDLRIYHFAYLSDGTMIFSGGTQMREIVILSR